MGEPSNDLAVADTPAARALLTERAATASTFVQYANVLAPKYQLPIGLVVAMIRVESGGDPYAFRCEPNYRYLWDVAKRMPIAVSDEDAGRRLPPKLFYGIAGESSLTEWIGQQASWGALQIMGAVARELGWAGPFPGLCMPMNGIDYGCKHLARLRDRFFRESGWHGVVASYNAGSPRYAAIGSTGFVNQSYVDKVAAAGGFDGLP